MTTELITTGRYIFDEDLIQVEDLETPPVKLDDLKENVQDPLEEVNLGTEDCPKPIYISQRFPEEI